MTKLTTEFGYRLTYTIPHEAYYKSVITDVSIGVQKAADEGGVAWEFSIVEKRNIGLRVEVFDDAWAAFAEIPELFAELARSGRTNLGGVRGILDDLGFEDATQRVEGARR